MPKRTDIHERGTMKWTSLMMPEHIAMLQKSMAKQYDVPQPVLSEDQREDIERILREASEYKSEVTVTYWGNNRLHTLVGVIERLNPNMRRIELRDKEDDLNFVGFSFITDIEIM
ncbi:YolD-like family protein [Terribacillus sp. 179-K 1B1 HS]|uniref:YolD-like family protein n=1 Tax=Terribacillus sp. 179-K 1B1 HS TaxID=3142388 RepID=UPI0039A1542E